MSITKRPRIGVVVVDKKWKKHGFESCKRVDFIRLSPEDLFLDRLISLQLDTILHKLSDFLLPLEDLKSIQKQLALWGGRVVDENFEILCDRRKTCTLLSWLTSHHHGGGGIKLPVTNECHLVDSLRKPVIRKPIVACSAKDSHSMCLYFNDKQVIGGTEYILQEYIPHGGILYKVYVVGDAVRVQLRPSLNINDNDGEQPITFNSQTMKKKNDPFIDQILQNSLFERHREEVESFSKALRTELGLTMFGWDLIFEEGTEQPFVIDVNYFPGFDDIGFLDLLCDVL